jgi:hypothetical protein
MTAEDGPVAGSLLGERRGLLGRRRRVGNDIPKPSRSGYEKRHMLPLAGWVATTVAHTIWVTSCGCSMIEISMPIVSPHLRQTCHFDSFDLARTVIADKD